MEVSTLVQQLGSWANGKGPLHYRLALAFEEAIRQGVLLPGTKLPAERALAQALAVSRTTVLTAYNRLRSDTWIESRTGSGTWVCKRQATVARQRTQTSIVARSPLINLLSIDDGEMVDFAVGTTVPLSELPSHLFRVDDEMQRVLLAERSYMPRGLPQLREALARYYTQSGLPTSSDQILVTCGAQQAISLVTSLYIQRGDTVLVENPTYFGALDAFRLAGARLAPVCVGPEHVNVSTLRDRMRSTGPRLLYLSPTYQNPTGAVMPEPARRSVAEMAEEFGVPIVEDGALAELSIGDCPPGPIARYSNSGVVLSIGSLSKLFWAGLRVGWVRGPISAIAQLTRVKTALDLGSPLLTQVIGTQLLRVIDEARVIRCEQLLARRNLLLRLLRARLPEWEFSVPNGGLYLWVRLPGMDGSYFAQLAARYDVAVTPGALFMTDDCYPEYLRIPFVLDEESIALGVDRLASAWRESRKLAHTRTRHTAPIV